jgi:mannose-6-phosphate isomerase
MKQSEKGQDQLYPLTFRPIFKERIWGGRNLETLYAKPLPPNLPIGESWEICDRPGDESIIVNGPLEGKTLHWLMRCRGAELLGVRQPLPERFPLLIKILDACETLSLQVHPPAALAALLGGEPKTEMWYVTHVGPSAELFVGLKAGTTRAEFENKLVAGTVAQCFHRIPVKPGDAMFLPSGRVHGLGAQTVIFEIQQNSDTTYRVFDWNRVDASGKARDLHVKQSLASIDFADFEPALLPESIQSGNPGTIRPLVKNELFQTELRKLSTGETLRLADGEMQILGVIQGGLRITFGSEALSISTGQFCLVPASCQGVAAQAKGEVSFLRVSAN